MAAGGTAYAVASCALCAHWERRGRTRFGVCQAIAPESSLAGIEVREGQPASLVSREDFWCALVQTSGAPRKARA